jgi:hypothetical protein
MVGERYRQENYASCEMKTWYFVTTGSTVVLVEISGRELADSGYQSFSGQRNVEVGLLNCGVRLFCCRGNIDNWQAQGSPFE